MKKSLFLLLVAFLTTFGVSAQSNDESGKVDRVPVNRNAYPDYVDPQEAWEPEPSLLKYKQMAGNSDRAKAMRRAAASEFPDHWDNADFKHFPAVFNQSGGSCGSASRISYMFTHEMNSFRDADASDLYNRYPSHFVWLLTYGNSGKDAFVQYVGVPSAKTYGGITTSSIYGSNADTQDPDFGWMQGYDKWYEGFFNRMQKPTHIPYHLGTEEGRLAAKAWLYNHAGDEDFHSGGLIGLGVASGGNWKRIPSTTNNAAAGVVNMYYVHAWGTSVDHALTMVGWDDRIEFDLDGNGIAGEVDKDEVGAWIIVNSWGDWCNGGFIYCPYANAGPTGSKYGGSWGGYWTGELYKVRKNYRPLRTIKLKVQYSRRSELKLQCGISDNLTTTKPDNTIDMHHFQYAGDGNYGNTNPAPEVPMLGKWSDGTLHTEAMEFGYDLTDLTAGYDRNKPLKYFFIINTKSWAAGEGKILGASLIDYEHDTEGIETPFDFEDNPDVEIKNAGQQTIISVIVHGAGYYAPNSLSINNGRLTWMAPDLSSHTVVKYNIYYDQYKIAETTERYYDYDQTTGDALYSVTAVYEDGTESAKVSVSTPVESQGTENRVITFNGGGFSIPEVFASSYSKCTIEFLIKPTAFTNYNCQAGPGWGTWLQHCDSNAKYYCGWNTGSDRITSSSAMTKTWQHMAIVVNGNKMTLFKNGTSVGTITSGNFSGIGGFGDYVFTNGSNGQYAKYDEIRIWSSARTATELRGGNSGKVEYTGSMLPSELLAYYKGDTFQGEDGNTYLRDCVGGHHARLLDDNYAEEIDNSLVLKLPTTTTTTLKVNNPGTVYANLPVTLSATRSYNVKSISWTIPELGIENLETREPNVTFTREGTFDVTVNGVNYAGLEKTHTIQVTVVRNEEPVDATFRVTSTLVNAGDRVSFIPNSDQPGCSYKWHFEGAEVEDVNSTSAAATYKTAGVNTATLTVTAPDGRKASSSVDITVRRVAPVANFEIDNSILTLGESITMTSTSKYEPTEFEWILANNSGTTVIKGAGAEYSYTPEESGRYSITLNAANDVGHNSTTKENVFVVANDDSKNGLLFGDGYKTARADFQRQPIAVGTKVAYTVDFWANINKLQNYCLAMGKEGVWEIYADENGCLYLESNGTLAQSSAGYIIPGEWHNYCVRHTTTGTVSFYRDAVMYGTMQTGTYAGMPECSTFSIGTLSEDGGNKSGKPFVGAIDELRFWGSSLTATNMQKYINRHLDDAETLVTETAKLLAYYDFNQNGGTVIPDRTGLGNNLTRYNFGPEGDAWGLSKGVFTLDFTKPVSEDVTTKKVSNNKRAFARSNEIVNNTVANRFYKITGWTLENTTVKDGITTGVHVDVNKNSDFTCTTGWDEFADLTNHKAYQVATLDPGFYTLTVTFGQHGAAGDSYLVAAEGDLGLPDADKLNEALGYNSLTGDGSSTCSMQFLVDETKQISFGVLVGSMSGRNIFTIQKFQMKKSPVEVITGIGDVKADGTDVENRCFYDLQGRRLQSITAPGLYIVNGKKVMIK